MEEQEKLIPGEEKTDVLGGSVVPESKDLGNTESELKKRLPDVQIPTEMQNRTERARLVSQTRQISISSGPFPPPEILAQYEKVVKNGAERIFIMAENQHAHRIKMEAKAVNEQLSQSRSGQIFALVVALTCISASVFLAYSGHDTVAGVIGGATILGLVATFITGKKSQNNNLGKKVESE